MLRGHYANYDISGSSRCIRWFACQVEVLWKKWLARRHRGGAPSTGPASTRSSSAIRFPQRGSSTAFTPTRAKLSREEPDAGNLHVRVCEGWEISTSPPTRHTKQRKGAMTPVGPLANATTPRSGRMVAFGPPLSKISRERARTIHPGRMLCQRSRFGPSLLRFCSAAARPLTARPRSLRAPAGRSCKAPARDATRSAACFAPAIAHKTGEQFFT